MEEPRKLFKAGLILEGGGMRGAYTAGVLDFFLDKNLEFEEVYGVSAGSIHATSYLSRQRGRNIAVSTDYLDDPGYCSLKSLIKTGNLFGVKMCYDQIPNELNPYDYETFLSYPGRFYAVLTDCETGKPHYHRIKDMKRDIWAIRASSSLPLVSRMIGIHGHIYLDGGIADSIPIKHSEKQGNIKNVVILTRDKSYRKGPNRAMKLIRNLYRQYPNLIEQMETRHIRYNETLEYIEEEEKEGRIFVIRPSKIVEVSRIEKDKEKLMALYHQGYEDAEEAYPALRRFLETPESCLNAEETEKRGQNQ